MGNTERIRTELAELTGAATWVLQTTYGEVIFFMHNVKVGTHAGENVLMGISMQGNEGYPDIPPHFIHVPEGITDGQDGPHHCYNLPDGRTYHAFSRPPEPEEWDRVSERSMRTYINTHLPRFWRYAQ